MVYLPLIRSYITDRSDSFRPDYRVPPMFRIDEDHYEGSGYDRGHLIASANRLSSVIANSETFLMSNMSPQLPSLNRGLWKSLEEKVRKLSANEDIIEVYSLSGPLWAFGKDVEAIMLPENPDIFIPIPHMFFKCNLTENHRGTFRLYSFILPNEDISGELSNFQFTTNEVEVYSGLHIWDKLSGASFQRKKERKYRLWF